MHPRNTLLFIILIFVFSCQYFNAYFNAESSFDDAMEEIVKANASFSERAGVYSYAEQGEISSAANKNLELSIKQAWKVIELYTDSADYADDAMFLIGRANFFLKDYPKSIESFSDLIDNYAESEYWQESWLWLSDSYMANADTAKALQTLELAGLKEFESETEIKLLTRRGSIAISQMQYELAISFYSQALALAKDDFLIVSIRLLMARSYYEMGDYNNALVNATIAYEENEDDDLTRLALRRIILSYIAKKDIIYTLKWIEEGRSDFDNVSDFGWYELQRGELFLTRGNQEEAIAQWQMVIEDYPKTDNSADAALNISEYYRLETGQYDSAFKYISTIPTNAWQGETEKIAHLKKWKEMLQKTVNLQNAIKVDSLILAKADSDSSFYYAPENFSFLIQEIQIELEKDEEKQNAQTSKSVSYPVRSTGALPQEAQEMDEYLNTDSLMSILEQIRIVKSDSMNFTLQDSIALDSLSQISSFIQSKLFSKKRLNYASIESVKKHYRESLFELAEYMLIEYEDYLSAQVYYRDYLNIFVNDTTQRDRALFALGFIDWRNGRDPYKIKYFEEVLDKYPDSPSAKKVYLVRGIEIVDEQADAIAEFDRKYNIAQNFYYDNLVDSSLTLLTELRGEAPTVNEYTKVILMEAFIYKNYWKDVDSLYSRYQILAKDFSDTPQYKLIEPEYLAIKAHKAYLLSLDSVMAVSDSLIDSANLVLQQIDSNKVAQDSTFTAKPDSIDTGKVSGVEKEASVNTNRKERLNAIVPEKAEEKKQYKDDVD